MARYDVIGLFHETGPVSDAVDRLRGMGIPDTAVEVISGIPYAPMLLERPKPKQRLGLISLTGAILGVLLALFLTYGIYALYTLDQGGQPRLFPVPPSLIVFFEVTMLGTMWITFLGFFLLNRFPTMGAQPYSKFVTEGHIGVVARVDPNTADKVEDAYNQAGAHHIERIEVPETPDRSFLKFWVGFAVIGAVATIILGIFIMDLVRIPFPTQMTEQESVAYEQGPRLQAPAEAVPIQGPVFINDQPATEPLKSSPESIQRGSVLFGLNCQLCHGQTGVGNGTVGAFFNPKPADLTSPAAQSVSDQGIFTIVSNGFGVMPALYENLTVRERWDVVNYVRTLKK